MNRLALYAAGAVIAVTTCAGGLGLVYLKGRADEGAERDRAALETTLDAVRVNLQSWEAANAETAHLIQENGRLYGDLDHARRRLENFNAAPAPGRVGRTALVDPALSRVFICDQQRLRDDQPSPECGSSAEDGVD